MSDGEVNIALLAIQERGRSGVPKGWVGIHHFGFQCDDLPEQQKKIEKAGGKLFFDLGEPADEGFERKFKDPNGIVFDINWKGWQLTSSKVKNAKGGLRPREACDETRGGARKKVGKKTAPPGQDAAQEKVARHGRNRRFQGRKHEKIFVSLALVGAAGRRRAGAELSDAPGDDDRAVRGGRTRRHHGPDRRRHFLAPSRPAIAVENIGGAGGTTGTTRGRRRPRRHHLISGHLGTNALAGVFYPNLAYDAEKDFEPVGLIAEQPELLDRAKGFPGQQPPGIRRLRQSEREQTQHGACRRGLGVLHRLPAAQLGDRHQAHSGAVHRNRPGDECDPRGPGGLRLRSGAGPAAACGGWHRQRAGDRGEAAQPAAARRADRGRAGAAGVRMRAVLRGVRAQGHAEAGDRQVVEVLNKGLDEPAVRTRLESLGATVAEPSRRGPKALADLVHSEIARLTPILKAAAAK